MYSLVGNSDYNRLMEFNWHATWNAHTKSFYATRHNPKHPKRGHIWLHVAVLGVIKGKSPDHINHDTLDNRRANLRPATKNQNAAHHRMKKNNTSGYCGLNWKPRRNRWEAWIRPGGRRVYLGSFKEAVDAAKAYDTAAKKYYGEFASLNFPE
jgi:hypothetical protein